jgi:phosphatidylserine/phosphatidylglycerophosphate/cardiolipin synthase-like enzyme
MTMTLTDWLLTATGFTGALTLVFFGRVVLASVWTPPSIECRFSPAGGCTEAVVHELKQAHREILVQAYSFTSRPIAEALVEAKLRGVHVEILLDLSNEKEEHTDLHYFVEQGLAPLIDAKHAIAHNKVMILDGKTVVTGSFNFTQQAEAHNAENLLILKGHPELVQRYKHNFSEHKAHCRAPEVQRDAAAASSRRAA